MVQKPLTDRGHDPCLPIQADLSAMLDGELDPASVRRVMVHSDVCPSCSEFLASIRAQVRMHRRVAAAAAQVEQLDGAVVAGAVGNGPDSQTGSLDPGILDAVGLSSDGGRRLRDELTANRLRLARILYELGRGFVLMGLLPDFSRVVAKEPVPVPDVAMRGRSFVDEVSRSGSGAPEWVAAKDLFDGQIRTREENLAKGQRLLAECIALDPGYHEARIYAGLVHHVRGQRALARKEFQLVLTACNDRRVRGFALLNLGNIYLDEGDCDQAVKLLLELVDSGVVQEHPTLGTAYFNLGLAYGMSGSFRDSVHWFQRMERELPHRRAWMAKELERRRHFVHLVRNHPDAEVVIDAFPGVFKPAG
jgi:hypothetical protein